MDRATRPLVMIAAFAASLAVGLLAMTWAMGGLKNVAAPAALVATIPPANAPVNVGTGG